MKSFIQKFWMLIFILCTSVPSYAYDFEVDGLYYYIVSTADLTCEVAPQPKGHYSGDIVVPQNVSYKGRNLKVISIGGAFENCSFLTSVKIPNSVTTINDYAFSRCSSLTSVVLPENLTEIGKNAFSGCSSLTSINIPNSVTTIDDNAFIGCSSLTSVVLPENLTEIGDYAFSGCSSLTSINIPNSVTEIPYCAFNRCSSLTSVVLPENLTEIGKNAFSGCSSLTSINIPNSVTTINHEAFSKCSSLKNIQLSNGLTRLEYGLFSQCHSLSALTIPGNIDSLILYKKSSYYHDSDISDLFYECIGLKELTIEYSPNKLSANYGYDNYGVYSATDLVFALEFAASEQKKSLPIERVTIDRELSNSIRLNSIKHYTIGEHIMKNQVYLSYSTNLETIVCYSKVPPTGMNGLTNLQYTDVIVKVPKESLDAYKNAEGWKNFWNIECIEETGGINDIEFEDGKTVDNYVVYNLQGVMVLKTENRDDVMQLPTGLYIVNGKKIFVR